MYYQMSVAAYFDVRHIELLLDAPLDFSRASSLHCASSIEATMDAVAGACQVRILLVLLVQKYKF